MKHKVCFLFTLRSYLMCLVSSSFSRGRFRFLELKILFSYFDILFMFASCIGRDFDACARELHCTLLA